jgi:DNA repair protein SbcC/Rad50
MSLGILEIRNYQSLRHVKLKLGRFTVITGPTGSGKSAIFRAIRLAAFNARGTSYIRTGEKTCYVGLSGSSDTTPDDDWALGIRRGARGQDLYVISLPGREAEEFTKLSGQVPAPVAELHKLTELNFSSQFDPPFLLSDTGGEIARVLGKLTKVTMLFNAAREANRRRLGIATQLKNAEAELAQAREQARTPRFAGLGERRAAVQRAEKGWDAVQAAVVRQDRLRQLLDQLGAAQQVLSSITPGQPLDVTGLSVALAIRARLRTLLADVHGHRVQRDSAVQEASVHHVAAQSAERELQQLLVEAGVCPTCGRPTH